MGDAFLDKLLADDFLDVSWKDQIRTKADLLKDNATVSASQRLSELRVRVFGNTAVVTGLNTVTGPRHSYVAHLRFSDVFVRRANAWHAVSAQETLIGKP